MASVLPYFSLHVVAQANVEEWISCAGCIPMSSLCGRVRKRRRTDLVPWSAGQSFMDRARSFAHETSSRHWQTALLGPSECEEHGVVIGAPSKDQHGTNHLVLVAARVFSHTPMSGLECVFADCPVLRVSLQVCVASWPIRAGSNGGLSNATAKDKPFWVLGLRAWLDLPGAWR